MMSSGATTFTQPSECGRKHRRTYHSLAARLRALCCPCACDESSQAVHTSSRLLRGRDHTTPSRARDAPAPFVAVWSAASCRASLRSRTFPPADKRHSARTCTEIRQHRQPGRSFLPLRIQWVRKFCTGNYAPVACTESTMNSGWRSGGMSMRVLDEISYAQPSKFARSMNRFPCARFQQECTKSDTIEKSKTKILGDASVFYPEKNKKVSILFLFHMFLCHE